MGKKLWIAVISGIILITLGVVGWFTLSSNDNNAQPNVKPSSTSSADAVASKPGSTKAPTQEEAKKVLDEMNDLDKVEAVEFFTAEETKEALVVAQEYAQASLNNRYFLSGKWAEADYRMSDVDASIGSYFSKELRAELNTWDDEGKKDTISQKDLLPIIFYTADNGEIAPSKYCAFDGPTDPNNPSAEENPLMTEEGIIACPISGVEISNLKYSPQQVDDGQTPGIVVTFSASADIPVTLKEGSKDAKTSVTYDYQLFLIKNAYQEETTNPKPFVIAEYDTKVLASKVELLDAE